MKLVGSLNPVFPKHLRIGEIVRTRVLRQEVEKVGELVDVAVQNLDCIHRVKPAAINFLRPTGDLFLGLVKLQGEANVDLLRSARLVRVLFFFGRTQK